MTTINKPVQLQSQSKTIHRTNMSRMLQFKSHIIYHNGKKYKCTELIEEILEEPSNQRGPLLIRSTSSSQRIHPYAASSLYTGPPQSFRNISPHRHGHPSVLPSQRTGSNASSSRHMGSIAFVDLTSDEPKTPPPPSWNSTASPFDSSSPPPPYSPYVADFEAPEDV